MTTIAHDADLAQYQQCECAACLDTGIQEIGDRFIIADWSERNCQWQSSDLPARHAANDQSYRYSVARRLTSLVGLGIRTYPTRAAARDSIRRAMRCDHE
jgi:hypothetical protein